MFRNPDIRNVIVLLGLAVLLWIPRLQGPIDLRYDAGVYYITGTSLAEGKGYRLLSEPGEIQAVQYPPLLPAFVAAHQWVLGTSDPAIAGRWLRLSFCLIFILYILAVYGMARQYLAATSALLVALITTSYLYSLFLSDLLFADIPFALVTTLFIISSRWTEKWCHFTLTAVLGMMAYLLRTVGIALLGAWVLESLLKKSWKQATLRTLASLIPLVAWQAYVGHVTSSQEYQHPAYPYQRAPYLFYNVTYAENLMQVEMYTPELGRVSWHDLAKRFLSNLATVPTSLGEGITAPLVFWHWLLSDVHRVLDVALIPAGVVTVSLPVVGCLVVAGASVLLARREALLPSYIAASVALVCLTTYAGQFPRYLAPVTPFLALCLVQLLAASGAYAQRRWDARGRRVGQVVTVLVMATVLTVELYTVFRCYRLRYEQGRTYAGPEEQSGSHLFFYDDKWRTYDGALAWLKQFAKSGEIIATSVPHWTYLKTGRQAVMPPLEVDPEKMQQLLDSVPVTYVIVEQLGVADDIMRRYAQPAIEKYPKRWLLVYCAADGRASIYRRLQ
jgi:hypothetical protein